MNTQKGTTMTELRGVWFAPESDPGPENISGLIEGALMSLPNMTHGTITSRLPNGTVVHHEGMMTLTQDHLRLIPALSGDDEMTGWPVLIPWGNVVSVEVS